MASGKWRPFCFGLNVLRASLGHKVTSVYFMAAQSMLIQWGCWLLGIYTLHWSCDSAVGISETLVFLVNHEAEWSVLNHNVKFISLWYMFAGRLLIQEGSDDYTGDNIINSQQMCGRILFGDTNDQFKSLVEDRSNSIANTLELLQSCTKPSN